MPLARLAKLPGAAAAAQQVPQRYNDRLTSSTIRWVVARHRCSDSPRLAMRTSDSEEGTERGEKRADWEDQDEHAT